MKTPEQLNDPWLTAAWPGMGAVAISAGYYLMAKLGMHLLAEFPAREFFDVERIEVKNGVIRSGRLPRSRLFLWHDPQRRHDLIVFIGEAQPPAKGVAFCSQLIEEAIKLGVRRVFTFAAMATQMRPEHPSRVFAAAIDAASLVDFKSQGVVALEEGHISGLNGVLLSVAAERGMSGGCLLGEMPQVFSQFPFPKASLAVLKAFAAVAQIRVDTKELEAHSRQVEQGLSDFLQRLENSVGTSELGVGGGGVEESKPGAKPAAKPLPAEDVPQGKASPARLKPEEKSRVNELFSIARNDRSRAYELKQELDRLKVFEEYEDLFLDLFIDPR